MGTRGNSKVRYMSGGFKRISLVDTGSGRGGGVGRAAPAAAAARSVFSASVVWRPASQQVVFTLGASHVRLVACSFGTSFSDCILASPCSVHAMLMRCVDVWLDVCVCVGHLQ